MAIERIPFGGARSNGTILRTAAITAALVLCLSACGDQSGKNGPTQEKLIIWQTEADSNAVGVLKEIEKQMEAKHKGLDVQVETINWGSLSERMTGAIQTGSVPDLAHIQPFMLTSLVSQGLLVPLDDVASDIKFRDTAYPALVALGERDGHIYGLPYAVGTTFWSYRADIYRAHSIPAPRTWQDVLISVRTLHKTDPDKFVLLPGASPFFIDQLFAELMANNGGRLFNSATGDPELNSPAVRDVVRFFIDLKATGALDPNWASQTYQDQFARFPNGDALLVPVTYARAAVAIEKRQQELVKKSEPHLPAMDPDVIGALDQPAGPRWKGAPVATIDAEPYVMFKAAVGRKHDAYAKEFLHAYYERTTYLRFVSQVPIHLTPIQRDLRNDEAYLSAPILKHWMVWQEHTDAYLNGAGGRAARPILMPDPHDAALQFLFEFQNEKILSSAVQRALVETPRAGQTADQLAGEIAQDAQCRTVDLLRRLSRPVSAPAAAQCDQR